MSEIGVIAIRWALYVDLGLLFGLPLFALYALGGGRTVRSYLPLGPMIVLLVLLGLLLSVLGFLVQASAMTGLPLTRPDLQLVSDLLNDTALGTALKVRLAALVILLPCAALYGRKPRVCVMTSTLAGAIALGTLAWSGHGAAGEGSAGWQQLASDLVHLLAAGAWVGAIAAFLALVIPNVDTDGLARVLLTEQALRGFSMVGTVVVGLLVVTGTVNTLFLVGSEHIAGLWQSSWGLLLTAKLVLFAGMLGLAALNRYRLTPSLSLAIEQEDAPRAMTLLRGSLVVEGGLAIIILALVAWLGTLSPPMST